MGVMGVAMPELARLLTSHNTQLIDRSLGEYGGGVVKCDGGGVEMWWRGEVW